jgi:hypothetical protein
MTRSGGNSILLSSCVFKARKYISVCWRHSNVLWAPANTFFFGFLINSYTGCPIIFCGTTSLPVIEYSNFFIIFINEHITLMVAFFGTKIFNRSHSRVT